MRRHLLVMILATCAVITTGTTYAQSIPGFGSTSSGGGLSGLAGSASGLMGGLLPSVSSTSASNAAGVFELLREKQDPRQHRRYFGPERPFGPEGRDVFEGVCCRTERPVDSWRWQRILA
jgi:hypothetical protein